MSFKLINNLHWRCTATPPVVAMRVALLALLVLVSACGKTELGPQAYTIAVALDRVLEKQDTAQLAQASQLIESQHQAGDLTSEEANRLAALVAMAKADNWSGARAQLRQLLVDQTQW